MTVLHSAPATAHPYRSKLSSTVESEIVIGYFDSPSKITDKKIKSFLKVFFRYTITTSAHYPYTWTSYAYRLWLTYLDQRNKKANVLIKLFERVILLGAAVGALRVGIVALRMTH